MMPEMHTDTADASSPSPLPTNRTRRRADAGERHAAGGPDRQAIERRAYELYLERGAGHGNDVDDWLRAEQQLAGVDAELTQLRRSLNDAPGN